MTKPGVEDEAVVCVSRGRSGGPDVGCLLAFRAIDDVELDALAFAQRAVAVHLDGAVVHENVVAVLA